MYILATSRENVKGFWDDFSFDENLVKGYTYF